MGLLGDVLASIMNIKRIEQDIEDLRKEVLSLKKQIQGGQIATKEKCANTENLKKEMIISDKSAKEVFTENVNLILPILEDLAGGNFNGDKWIDLIKSLNCKELVSIWSKISGKADSVFRILAVWGFRPELCTSFTCIGNEDVMYKDLNSEKLEQGVKYEVIKKCWLFTGKDGNKTVVVKGVVKKTI